MSKPTYDELLAVVRAFAKEEPVDYVYSDYQHCPYCRVIAYGWQGAEVKHKSTCRWIQACRLMAQLNA